ncbi:glycoprotein 3-alpha-L-fucosyltransferase A, partial [Elysia marginata]
MGAAPEDYARAAPPHSFIHVDDFESPKGLAEYLDVLDKNDALYNEYFRWKGTGDLINTFFWCRVCALAHDTTSRGPSWYNNINEWWRGKNICIGKKNWRE